MAGRPTDYKFDKILIDGIFVYCAHNEIIDITKLIPNPRNPNKHPKKQIELLAKIIKNQGWRTPITVSNRSGFIVRGHGRFLAAQELGVKKVPIDRQDYKNEAEEWADLIADNRIAELAEIDNLLLKDLFQEIDTGNIDMDLTGFDNVELEKLMSQFCKEKKEILNIEEEINKIKNPITKLGDVWKIGKHFLLCGDSTKYDNIQKLTKREKIDLFIYDPPYAIENIYTFIPKNEGGKLITFWDCKRTAEGIIKSNEKGWPFLWEFIWDCQTSWYIPNRPLMRHKGCGIFGNEEKWNFEKALYNDGKIRETKIVTNTRGRYKYKPNPNGIHLQTVYSESIAGMEKEHPHTKPENWIKSLIGGCEANTVLDFFGGSGTSLIAAEANNAQCFIVEIDPIYCDLIIIRAEKELGIKAEKQ